MSNGTGHASPIGFRPKRCEVARGAGGGRLERLGGEAACLSPWVCIECGRVIEHGQRRRFLTGDAPRPQRPGEPTDPGSHETVGPFHEACVNAWLERWAASHE